MKANRVEKQANKAAGKSALAKRLRWVLIFAAVVVAIGASVFLWWTSRGTDGSDKESGTFTVRRGPLTISVTENGDIKALNSRDIKSEVEGRTTIISIVDEGTIITPEDVNNDKVLVELDSSDIKQRLTQQEITFLNAEASYIEAKESLDIQKKQNDSDIKAGQMEVRFTLMDLQKYLGEVVAEKLMPAPVVPAQVTQAQVSAATNPDSGNNNIVSLIEDPKLGGEALQKLRERNDNIILAESRFEQASDELMWTKKLYEKQYVAETKLRADQLEVQSLEIQVKRARTASELFKLYEFPKEAEKLLSDYDEAKRDLERIEARARSKLAQAQAKLKSNEATYSLQKERLEKWRKQLEACIIRAPAPGQVVYSSSTMERWRRRDRLIEVGAEVRERQKIISIPDSSEMIAEISVHETSVDKVRPGQTAKIVIDAFPDRTFQGKVLKVAPLPDPQHGWLSPDLKVYTTKVSIEGSFDFLKPGMSAKVEILVEQLDDVIIVPVQVVANRGGKKVCFCLATRGPEQRQVRTGAFNDTFVQIIDGLEVGEEVLLNPPRLIEPSAVAKLKQRQRPPQDRKPPQKEQLELTDEATERIMAHLAETNPEEAKKLKQLREKDPEKFKAELKKTMLEQYKRIRQGKGGMKKRAGNARVP